VGVDYNIPAIRQDVAAGGERLITVASGELIWNETEPGVYAGPGMASAEEAAERLMPIWLLPPALVIAGVAAADQISVERGVLTVPLAGGRH
jgi:hypothetical protein